MNHVGEGILTPELLHSDITGEKPEVFYHSPANATQQAMIFKDQQQTYFTSDSNERLNSGGNNNIPQRRKTDSLNMQGSPRTSYYSPQRNLS